MRWQSQWNGMLLLRGTCPAPSQEHSLGTWFCPLVCVNWEIHPTLLGRTAVTGSDSKVMPYCTFRSWDEGEE